MKNVLITGGAGGIGSEIVKAFVANGYFALVVDADEVLDNGFVIDEGSPDDIMDVFGSDDDADTYED